MHLMVVTSRREMIWFVGQHDLGRMAFWPSKVALSKLEAITFWEGGEPDVEEAVPPVAVYVLPKVGW